MELLPSAQKAGSPAMREPEAFARGRGRYLKVLVSKNDTSPDTRHSAFVLLTALLPGDTISRDFGCCLFGGYPGKPIIVSSVLRWCNLISPWWFFGTLSPIFFASSNEIEVGKSISATKPSKSKKGRCRSPNPSSFRSKETFGRFLSRCPQIFPLHTYCREPCRHHPCFPDRSARHRPRHSAQRFPAH
jgi:hypothetical protein